MRRTKLFLSIIYSIVIIFVIIPVFPLSVSAKEEEDARALLAAYEDYQQRLSRIESSARIAEEGFEVEEEAVAADE